MSKRQYRGFAYEAYRALKRRCTDTASRSYHNYGERGITVCASWDTFRTFVDGLCAEIGQRPVGLQLDRIDNNRGYEPGNVRWATPRENSNNKRTNKFIEYRGEVLTVTEWERRLGFSDNVIQGRLRTGWTVEEALTKPPEIKRRDGKCPRCGLRPRIKGPRSQGRYCRECTAQRARERRTRLATKFGPKSAIIDEQNG